VMKTAIVCLALIATAFALPSTDTWEEHSDDVWEEDTADMTGPPLSAGNPTRFPWTKKCTEGEKSAFVDGTNGKDYSSWDGSEAKPYKTIQYAVTKFTGTCTTIYIKAGTYYNKGYKGKGYTGNYKNNKNKVVNLDKVTDLIIRNFENDKVLIKFDGPGGFIGGSATDDSKLVHDLEIYGLEIEGPNQDITYAGAIADRPTGSNYYAGRGIAIWKGQRIHIHDMLVHDTPAAGMRVDNSDYVVIEDSEVYHTTWWANSAESAVVLGQSINIDDEEGIKMILRNNKVYRNMNKIPYYNKSYKWYKAPIGNYDCKTINNGICESENTDGCATPGDCQCPWQCRYGKISQDYIIDGQGVYVTRNSDTYLKGKMEMSGNEAFLNGINGLVFHRTFRGFVKNNKCYDNGQVPKDGFDQDIKEATDWMAPLAKTRQPYSGLVLNNADGVKLWGNTVRARYEGDYAFTMEIDSGEDFDLAGGGGNKNCRGKVDDKLASYVSTGTASECSILPDPAVEPTH